MKCSFFFFQLLNPTCHGFNRYLERCYSTGSLKLRNNSPYPVRGEGQSHALKLASRLAEGEVMLFGFGNDEIELDLVPKQQVSEGEGMQGGLIQLKTHTLSLHFRHILFAFAGLKS